MIGRTLRPIKAPGSRQIPYRARAPDLAALTASGARNVTGEFVAWYLANPPA